MLVAIWVVLNVVAWDFKWDPLQHEQMDILKLLKQAQERQTEILEMLHQGDGPLKEQSR